MKSKALFLTLAALFLASCASNADRPLTTEEKKAEAYYSRGTTDLVNKDYTKALSHLLKAKEYDPKDSKTRNNLGMAYFFRNQLPLAEQELKEATELDSKNSDARLNLGSLYLSQNRLKEARVQFEKVELDLVFPNQFRNYYNLAILSLKEGDRRMSFEYLSKSIKEKNDYCAAHYKLGELHAEEYRFKQALEAFRESGKGTCVNEPAPHYQQALALVNMNKPLEAKRKFQEIAEKFSKTRFAALASAQIQKINNSNDNQPTTRATQTEVIKDTPSVETPNF